MAEETGWGGVRAPDFPALKALAEAALARLPAAFRSRFGSLVILVEDFPDDETLRAMGLTSPFDLLGLYRGIDLTRAGTGDLMTAPNMIHLYRRPILDVWAEGEETLGALVSHVLIHEIGHHFGLSDEAMDAIERAAESRSSSDA
jgi:predicted Zn-dependent protease with MMP-like domain